MAGPAPLHGATPWRPLAASGGGRAPLARGRDVGVPDPGRAGPDEPARVGGLGRPGGAVVLAYVVRFVLGEEVYPRVLLPRGVPYAVSTLIRYAIILTGFVVAVLALGVDLNRITILAGAFGVGVGIGLQSAVANFVAGLILLLERRIHVGDSVQIGDLQGQVRVIGSRASTIRTWDGADVIVPNASLTSERVTNWTLSDRLRRVALSIGVAYTADPERVMAILRDVARAHPKALADPAPVALCTGFGESALKFVLRVWTARFEEVESV